VALCNNLPDEPPGLNEAAAEGTVMHEIAATCLLQNLPSAKTFLNCEYEEDGFKFTIDEEQIAAIDSYIQTVQELVKTTRGELLVEQRLSIEHLTGEEGAKGTADAVILTMDEIIVVDAKFGRGVPVSADHNPQLLIYAHAAVEEFQLAYDFKKVCVMIVQPRLNSTTEFTLKIAELNEFGFRVEAAAKAALDPLAPTRPSPKACQWCRAKATCPSIRNELMSQFENVDPEFASEQDLAKVMHNAEMIERWIKAVRAEVERRLFAGLPMPGYKLVQGKRGIRQWSDDKVAETMLKTMRVKHEHIYKYSLASPTALEKLAKSGEIGPKQWEKLQEIITQAEGKPSVAPESDPRAAIVPSADASAFDDVTQ
jgi:RecB family exonuclease